MFWRRKGEAGGNAPAEHPADRIPEPEGRGALNVRPERVVDGRRATPRSPRAALEPERVPGPSRRSKGARHPMVVAGNAVFTLIIVLGLLVGGGVFYGKTRLDAPGPLAADKTVNVPRAGIRDVADTLQREGIIDQPWLFIATAMIYKTRGDLKSGEYIFPRQASVQDVLNTMVEGKVIQHAITIPEGLTSQQIVERLVDVDFLAGNIREMPREGSLLPETYRFPRGTAREQVIQRMQQAQRRVVQEAWERRATDLPLKSPEELVTLASIVEKETGRADERSRVAAVFVNRLNKKMRLQSDPTIIYGLVGGRGTLGRPITRTEITQPTPYNTYVIDGLPPGPIANPGRASIEATAMPARTKELFFVADGSGGHAFAETLDQHQKNVAKLRAIEKQITDSSVGATDDAPAVPATDAAPTAPAATPPKPRPAPRPAPKPAAAAQPGQSQPAVRQQTQAAPPVPRPQ